MVIFSPAAGYPYRISGRTDYRFCLRSSHDKLCQSMFDTSRLLSRQLLKLTTATKFGLFTSSSATFTSSFTLTLSLNIHSPPPPPFHTHPTQVHLHNLVKFVILSLAIACIKKKYSYLQPGFCRNQIFISAKKNIIIR